MSIFPVCLCRVEAIICLHDAVASSSNPSGLGVRPQNEEKKDHFNCAINDCHGFAMHLYAANILCMYLMIVKGQIVQKRPYWGENRPRNKIRSKYQYKIVF